MVQASPTVLPLLNNRWAPRLEPKDKLRKLRGWVQDITAQKGKQAGAQALRALCLRDLFFLCVEILEYRDAIEPLHDDMCDFMAWAEREKKTDLILIPRGHFKSTFATVGRSIQWLIRDQNTAIGLISCDKTNAGKFLREIRDHLEMNQRLKALFPEIFYADPQKESEKWTREEILVKRTKPKKEGSIKIAGLEDGLPTGDHYPHLLVDDAVTEDNVRTEERMKKVDTQVRYLPPLLMTPDQPIHFVGTHYHPFDVYNRLRKDPKVAVYHRQVEEGGAPIFPPRFTPEILEDTRIKLGNYIYSCQYMLEPVDPADKKFKREWLRWYDRPIGAEYGHSFFFCVDPASRRRKASDFTAILVFALDADWNFFLVDGVHDKLNPAQRIDAVFRLAKKWGVSVIGYETIGFQETDKFYIEQRQREEAFYFQIVEITCHKTRKDERIEGLQPIMREGKFWLPKGPLTYQRLWESPDDGLGKEIDIKEQFLVEFDFYPNSTHDDLLDAGQMCRSIVHAGHVPTFHAPLDPGADYGMARLLGQDEEDAGSPLVP